MMKPYDYQVAVMDGVRDKLMEGHKNVLVVASTGAGKTAVAVFITIAALKKGKRVWFVAPLDALIDQTYDSYVTALKNCGISSRLVGVIHPGFKPAYGLPIQVVAQKTAAIRISSHELEAKYFPNIMIEDEAHTTSFRAASTTILNSFYEAAELSLSYSLNLRLGLSGSPCRLSPYESMAQHYTAAVFAPSTTELTDRGKLAPLKVFESFDDGMRAVVESSGYDKDQIRTLYNTTEAISRAADLYEEHGERAKAIAFCVDVQHAKNLAAEFTRRGYISESIDFKTPRGKLTDVYPEKKTRRSMIKAYKEGKIHILTGKDVLAVGFDEKSAVTALLLRPTNSLATHIQQLGRVRRCAPDKPYGIVLDLVGNCAKHGFGDDEWTEDQVLEEPPEKDENGFNPFAVECCECTESIHAALKVCPHCGAEQPEKESVEADVKSFDGGLIETIRPQSLDPNKEEDAQRWYRSLRQRAVLVQKALPGLGFVQFSQSQRFKHWLSKIPRGASMWTLGSIFNAPDDEKMAEQFYHFLNSKMQRGTLNPDEVSRKLWYSMQLEFYPAAVDSVRAKVSAGTLMLPGAALEKAITTKKPKKISAMIAPPTW